jgi:sugar lactone lactonase YvrE
MPSLRARSRPLAVLTALAVTSAAVAGIAPAQDGGPKIIRLPAGWQPEGIAGGDGGRLFVGSIPTGRVLRINRRTGERRVLVPQRDDRAAIGLKVDRRRVFVAGGPTGHAYVYDARTGADIADVELTPTPTFVNDVTVAPDAAWFTDSARPQLYRLPLGADGAPATSASTLPITGDLQYDDNDNTFEVNGIASARGGRVLLVVQTRTGGLFRVDPSTGASTRVTLRGVRPQLMNADGILLDGRTLYVVQNLSNRVAVVRLSRDLRSGRILRRLRSDDFDVPTTIARVGRDLYVVNARFDTEPTPTTPYDIVRLRAR